VTQLRFFSNVSVVVNDYTFREIIGRRTLKPILFRFLVFIFLAVFFIVFGFTGTVSAQAPPTPPPRDPALTENVPPDQRFERFRIEQKIQQVTSPIPGVTVTSPQPPVNLDDKSTKKIFKLNKIIFDPIPTTLSLYELEAITNRYIAMDAVSIYDLYIMVTEIDSLFNRKRIIGRAGLPIQDIENGIVVVQIIEGKITKTKIKTKVQNSSICQQDQPTLNSTYRLWNHHFVQKQFRFNTRNSFNLQKLEDEILRYNRTFQSQLVAEIEPGDDLGSSTLNITHVLPKPVTAGYYVDNSGRETSGKIRNGVYLSLADIVGLDESFFVSYDETKGSTALYMTGEIPISRFGTFFDMTYYYGTPTTIAGPFAVLNINGTSEQYKPGFKQIILNTKEQRLDAYIRYENYNSTTYFDTALNYAEKMNAITVGLDYTRRGKTSAIFGGMSIITGDAGTLEPSQPTYRHRNFSLMKFNLMKVWYPNKKTTFILRGNGSAALSSLPQSQVFQIGGTATVRGTPEGLMSGDSGYLISAEGRYTIWDGADLSLQQCHVKPCESIAEQTKKSLYQKTKIELFGFIDHGGVFYRDYPPTMHPSDFLSSLGVGGTITLGKNLSATCGYGQPIFTAESHQSNYKEKITHGNMFFSTRVIY
jgi:hemolysin activation/secretion protein